MDKTTEKKIATWINKFANMAISDAAWQYKEKNPKIKTIAEAKEKMLKRSTFYPFFIEEENLTFYTNGYLILLIKDRVEGINYYEGNELKHYDYTTCIKSFQALEDKYRVQLYLPDKKKLKKYISLVKKYNKGKNVVINRAFYNFGKGMKYPMVNAEYLLAMCECVNQITAIGRRCGNICNAIATEDDDVLFILCSVRKDSDRQETNLDDKIEVLEKELSKVGE